jgi:hypothetical protein
LTSLCVHTRCAGSLVELGFSAEESRHALNVSPGNTSKARSILTAHRALEQRMSDGEGSVLTELSHSEENVHDVREQTEVKSDVGDVELTESEESAVSAVVQTSEDGVHRHSSPQQPDPDDASADKASDSHGDIVATGNDAERTEDAADTGVGTAEADDGGAATSSISAATDHHASPVPPALEPGGLWALAEGQEEGSSFGSEADSGVHDEHPQSTPAASTATAPAQAPSGRISPSYMQPTKSSRARSPERIADDDAQTSVDTASPGEMATIEVKEESVPVPAPAAPRRNAAPDPAVQNVAPSPAPTRAVATAEPAVATAEPEPEPEPEPELEREPQPKREPEPESEFQPELDAAPRPEPALPRQPEPVPHQKLEPEPEPEPDPAVHPDPRMQQAPEPPRYTPSKALDQPSEQRTLPPGWKARVSKTTGETYYRNVRLGVSQWEFPELSEDPQAPKETQVELKDEPLVKTETEVQVTAQGGAAESTQEADVSIGTAARSVSNEIKTEVGTEEHQLTPLSAALPWSSEMDKEDEIVSDSVSLLSEREAAAQAEEHPRPTQAEPTQAAGSERQPQQAQPTTGAPVAVLPTGPVDGASSSQPPPALRPSRRNRKVPRSPMRRQLTEAELKLKTPKERYDAALAENRPLSAEHRTPLAPKDRNPNGSQGQNQNQRRGVSPAGSAARRTPSSSASKPSKARLSSAERWPSLTQVSPQTSALEMLRVKQEEGRQGTAAGGSGLTSPPEQPRSSQPEPTPGASLQDHGGADTDSPSQAFSPVSAAALERHRRAVEAFREGTFDAVRPVGAHYCTAPHRTRHSSPRVAIAYIHFRAQQHRKLHQLVLWASHRAFLFRIVQRMEWKVRKRHFLSTFYIKMMILPRQARDKHRENSKKRGRFVAGCYM